MIKQRTNVIQRQVNVTWLYYSLSHIPCLSILYLTIKKKHCLPSHPTILISAAKIRLKDNIFWSLGEVGVSSKARMGIELIGGMKPISKNGYF